MPDTFKSNDIQIDEILRQIDSGKIQLPDFQRGWVWDDYRIKALIESIMNSYPVGALMFLGYGGNTVRFKYRPFTGSNIDTVPEELVLDGQQRLTSIYNALYCKSAVPTCNEKGQNIDRFYYLDIRRSLDATIDRADAIRSHQIASFEAILDGQPCWMSALATKNMTNSCSPSTQYSILPYGSDG
jgi:hypothetical protein